MTRRSRRAALRQVLLFVFGFVPLFAALLWLYPRVLPVYQPVPVAVANFVTQGLPTPTRIEITEEGGLRSYFPDGRGGEQPFWSWEEFVVHLVFLNLVLLPALVLATPMPWRKRLELLGIAFAALVAVNALSLILLVRGYLGLHHSPGSFFHLWLLRIAYASGQIFAAVGWALLTWRFWFRVLRR